MPKEKNTLPVAINAAVHSPEDVEWFKMISKKSRKKQTEAIENAVYSNQEWRVRALLSIPVNEGILFKSGIEFKDIKYSLFPAAIDGGNVSIMNAMIEHVGNANRLIDRHWYGSLHYAVSYTSNHDQKVITFLLDNGADPFLYDMKAVKRAISDCQTDTVRTFLQHVPFKIEALRELLPLAQNPDIYDMLETRLIAVENQRLEKRKSAQKQTPNGNTKVWFPMGNFQIMHLEEANDPLETTVRHIFNFQAQQMTRCVTDNKNANISETFNFSTSPNAIEFIQLAHEELSKENPDLPKLQSMRTITRKRS